MWWGILADCGWDLRGIGEAVERVEVVEGQRVTADLPAATVKEHDHRQQPALRRRRRLKTL